MDKKEQINMNIYISCFTSDFEIMKKKWNLKKGGYSLNKNQRKRYTNQTGAILEYAWDKNTLTRLRTQDCPFGMCTVGSRLFICDAKRNTIIVYNARTLDVIGEIHSSLFNDIHSITHYENDLIVSSSGIDTVVKVSLTDYSTEPVISFINSRNGIKIENPDCKIDKSVDYSKLHIATEEQATHLNYAAIMSDGALGVNLFHQGCIVSCKDNGFSFLVKGMYRSHAFFEYNKKLYTADSGNHCVRIYALPDFNFVKMMKFGGWVQDIKKIEHDDRSLMFVSDADNCLIHVYDLHLEKLIRTIQLPQNYRISSCELKLT